MGLDDQILVTFELHRSMCQRGSRASNLQLHNKIQLGFGGVTTGPLQRHEEGLSSLLATSVSIPNLSLLWTLLDYGRVLHSPIVGPLKYQPRPTGRRAAVRTRLWISFLSKRAKLANLSLGHSDGWLFAVAFPTYAWKWHEHILDS